MSAPPPNAAAVSVNNGKKCHQYAPPGAPGYLTDLGWKQAESLGRRIRREYGESARIVGVHSTDVSRTVLTAHGVLTGLFEGIDTPPSDTAIDVIRGPALGIDISCPALSVEMTAGRTVHRAGDADNHAARADIAAAFGAAYSPSRCSLIAVHDNCSQRRTHGYSPSRLVDGAMCDRTTRELAREVRATLRYGGLRTARMVSGRLVGVTSEHIAKLAATAPGEPEQPPALLLLSVHDTSLLGMFNALNAAPSRASRRESAPDPRGPLAIDEGEWPPLASCLSIELRDNGSVRVMYQFEPLFLQPVGEFLRDLRALSASEAEHVSACGESESREGFTFAE
jgi:hypothetical protein